MKNRFNYFIITVAVVFFAIAADVFIICQLGAYETRFLEIYGSEQDGYVKIILDQINRLEGQGTDEDITDIISTLDATASRYWTLSKGDSILFVKSVTETNRYKGFTDGTYYATETASAFMNSLDVNEVNHRIIYLDDDRFIASGMIFQWQGEQYRICLLTYDKVVLEDNILLECKNSIIIILSLILALMIIVSMMMSRKIRKQAMAINRQEERVVWQNQQIERLDERLKREYAFSASRHIFKNIMLDEFLEVLDEKDVCPLHFAAFRTESAEAREEFFERMQAMLDNRVLRFSMEGQLVLLVFVQYPREVSGDIIESLEDIGVRALGDLFCADNMKSYKLQFSIFWKAVNEKCGKRNYTGNTD
ncbi:MAG: hypothetical protein HFH36_04305 [Lachnospiraceae bacterium]|nr:hypothetical protein [Lachnospiraceae bacterium]